MRFVQVRAIGIDERNIIPREIHMQGDIGMVCRIIIHQGHK